MTIQFLKNLLKQKDDDAPLSEAPEFEFISFENMTAEEKNDVLGLLGFCAMMNINQRGMMLPDYRILRFSKKFREDVVLELFNKVKHLIVPK